MAENNPAGTPPANDPAPGGDHTNVGEMKKTLTQAEIDAIVEERLAREKKKYADYGDLKKAAAELAELKKSQMSELEKLKADMAERDKALQDRDAELSALRLERVKSAKLTEAGIAPEWIDSVSGSTEEEIAASVQKLAGRLKVTPPAGAQGAGNPGLQQQQKGPTIDDQIAAAAKAGNMQMLAHLKLKKQSELFK